MTDISPKDLWIQITSTPRPSKVIDFPRNGPDGKSVGELRMRVLSQEEQMLCSAEAERYTRKAIKELPKDGEAKRGYDDVYNNAAAVEVLFHVCRKKDDPELSFFPSRDALRKFLTPDEIGVLMVHYYSVQSQLGPIVANMSEQEVDAIVERLKEGGSALPLELLSWEALKDLAFILACRIHRFQTASISPGEPHESTSTPVPDSQISLPLL